MGIFHDFSSNGELHSLHIQRKITRNSQVANKKLILKFGSVDVALVGRHLKCGAAGREKTKKFQIKIQRLSLIHFVIKLESRKV